jgi:putative aldouronate transport system substrate-binding protein
MKKASLFLIALLISAALFAGGKQQDSSGGTGTASNLGPADQLPLVRDKVTYTLGAHVSSGWSQPEGGEFWANLERETNVHINWITAGDGDNADRYAIMMASGDYPDGFIGGWGGTNSNIIKYGVDQGIYIPITGLIKTNMPHFMKRAVTIEPNILAIQTAPDGNIYSLPIIWGGLPDEIPNGFFINKTWLDKLGLKAPTTTGEFTTILRAFKTRDPNGNGLADEIPYSFVFEDWGAYDHTSLFGSFGYPLSPNDYTMIVNGKVIFNGAQENFREGANYLAGLYAEGLIDREVFTQTEQALIAKKNLDPMTVGSFNAWYDYRYVNKEDHPKDYEVLMPLKGPRGDQNWLYSYSPVNRDSFMITNKAKNPEILLRWADQFYRDFETAFNCMFGLGPDENKAWSYDEQGRIVLNPVIPVEYQRTKQGLPFTIGAFDPGEWARITNMDIGGVEKLANNARYEAYIGKFRSGEWQTFPGYLFSTSEENEELSILQTELVKYAKNQLARWISGDGNVNAEWNNYLRELDRIGLQKYLELKQKVYDRSR